MKTSRSINSVFMIVLSLLLTTSCVSRKNIVYFQEESSKPIFINKDDNLKIEPGDLLTVRVSAPEQEAALPFNLTKSITNIERFGAGQVELETYMVSDQGTIEFPILGTVDVKDLTTFELSAKIREDITEYVRDPIVNVRILNFQISVLGEVRNPGTFTIEDDHLSLPKALGMAGDLTIQGKRGNVLVMREIDGKKINTYLDITDANVVNSPYYHLKQNDVVYVEPRAGKRESASSTGIASTYLSIASVLASLVILFTR